jgi:hypothetical protein
MNVVIHEAALRELREANEWYADHGVPAQDGSSCGLSTRELLRLRERQSPSRATRNGHGRDAPAFFVGRSRWSSR